ncbi:Serine racemase @ L-serine dehydratase, (PLP)-dependent @ D-serine ammonia-lyase [hydrothermal vent metagenome]|uniref:Serine racemase @ L-serine dehydratase, (PLP)-dependent @ D-serine ammonia-lyase n=1 Tax=hydrothermal vent metagenome TaxID=652676 RepID=A0A3B1CY45_9ZZZZ
MNNVPTKIDIETAHERIKNHIHKTPIFTSSSINKILRSNLFLKCENFQRAGAFKMRGATNAILSLSKKELSKGVATHSSGNHAGALALAAQSLNTTAYIAMPNTAPEIKIKAVESYGGKITFCKPTLDDREKTLSEIVKETGATFIHPYDNYRIIAGQATCAKEIFEELNNLDYLLAPLGGGGLLSGTLLSAKYFSNSTKVIGVEPKGADDAYRSIRDGEIYPSVNPQTIADGLLTSLSKKTFDIIKENVHEIITVEEETILEAMYLIWERMKIIIEPSSATVLAAVMENQKQFYGKSAALILSGGNIDIKRFQR